MVVDPAQQVETEPVVAEPEAVEETPAEASEPGWQSLEPWLPAPSSTEPTAEPASPDAPEPVQDNEDDDLDKPITRRRATVIAAEAVKAAETERDARIQAEARASRLEAERSARDQEEQQLDSAALAWLGSDDELSQLDQKIDELDGKAFGPGSVDEWGTLSDEAKQARAERVKLAGEKTEKLKARRFVGTLQRRVQLGYHQDLVSTADLVGLDPIEFAKLTVDTPTSKATLRTNREIVGHLVEHAVSQKVTELTAKHQAEIEELKATNEALKADRGSLRARAAGTGAAELETGGHGNGVDLTLAAYDRMGTAERREYREKYPEKVNQMTRRAQGLA